MTSPELVVCDVEARSESACGVGANSINISLPGLHHLVAVKNKVPLSSNESVTAFILSYTVDGMNYKDYDINGDKVW